MVGRELCLRNGTGDKVTSLSESLVHCRTKQAWGSKPGICQGSINTIKQKLDKLLKDSTITVSAGGSL